MVKNRTDSRSVRSAQRLMDLGAKISPAAVTALALNAPFVRQHRGNLEVNVTAVVVAAAVQHGTMPAEIRDYVFVFVNDYASEIVLRRLDRRKASCSEGAWRRPDVVKEELIKRFNLDQRTWDPHPKWTQLPPAEMAKHMQTWLSRAEDEARRSDDPLRWQLQRIHRALCALERAGYAPPVSTDRSYIGGAAQPLTKDKSTLSLIEKESRDSLKLPAAPIKRKVRPSCEKVAQLVVAAGLLVSAQLSARIRVRDLAAVAAQLEPHAGLLELGGRGDLAGD